MESRSVIPEKEDYKDCGPMGNYDDPNKPFCTRCESSTFISATGRTGKWKWCCSNCVTEWTPEGLKQQKNGSGE